MDPSVILDKSQLTGFEPENLSKDICVIWSGGCDSTLLLDNLLWEINDRKDRRTVTTYSFKHWQISDDKMAKEETARAAYKHHALSKGYSLGNCHTIEIPKQSISIGSVGACPQAAMWIANVLPLVSDNSLLYAGYIRGDDFFTYDIFKNWCSAFEGLSGLYAKSITPMFPLKYETKTSIIRKLKERNILNFTWHCEIPEYKTGKECGRCTSCEKHTESTLWLDSQAERDKKQADEAIAIKTAEEALKGDREKQVRDLVDAGTLKDINNGCYEIVQRDIGNSEAQAVS